MERLTQVTVEYENRTFIVKKMDPLEGIAVLKELLTKAMPLDLLGGIFKDGNGNMSGIGSMLGILDTTKREMSIEDFVKFEKRLLKNTYEVLKSGEVRIIAENGDYGVSGMEDNMYLLGFLMIKVIEVNYRDFFIEILLKLGIIKKAEDMTGKLAEVMSEAKAAVSENNMSQTTLK